MLPLHEILGTKGGPVREGLSRLHGLDADNELIVGLEFPRGPSESTSFILSG